MTELMTSSLTERNSFNDLSKEVTEITKEEKITLKSERFQPAFPFFVPFARFVVRSYFLSIWPTYYRGARKFLKVVLSNISNEESKEEN